MSVGMGMVMVFQTGRAGGQASAVEKAPTTAFLNHTHHGEDALMAMDTVRPVNVVLALRVRATR
jgi:hypothetical protein